MNQDPRGDKIDSPNVRTELLARAQALDEADTLAGMRDHFVVPDDLIYLDGNSLGLMAKSVPARLARTAEEEWGRGLIRSWSDAGWFDLPLTVGNRIAPLLGAGKDQVAVGESTSANLFKCMAAGLHLNSPRTTLLVEADNFPTDNYIAQGLADLVDGVTVRTFDGDLGDALDADVAVVVLSHIDYRTSRVRDMKAISNAVHAAGALVLWDVSHTTGGVPCDLIGSGAHMAVGCTYKYLNGGPGAPAFAWIAPDLIDKVKQPLSGWMGHKDSFDFASDYVPASGPRRLVCGTPQVLSLIALDEALTMWDQIDRDAVYVKSRALSELFIEAVESLIGPELTLVSPRNPLERGSHVAYRVHEGGLEIMEAMYQRGVLGDFRSPDLIRFGLAPLYQQFSEVAQAAIHLADVIATGEWKKLTGIERLPGT